MTLNDLLCLNSSLSKPIVFGLAFGLSVLSRVFPKRLLSSTHFGFRSRPLGAGSACHAAFFVNNILQRSRLEAVAADVSETCIRLPLLIHHATLPELAQYENTWHALPSNSTDARPSVPFIPMSFGLSNDCSLIRTRFYHAIVH